MLHTHARTHTERGKHTHTLHAYSGSQIAYFADFWTGVSCFAPDPV